MTPEMCRGKRLDTDNGQNAWVTGWYCEREDTWLPGERRPQRCGCIITDMKGPSITRFDVDSTTVGRCTGMRDRDGNLIFEDDLVRLPEGVTALVMWDRGAAKFIFAHSTPIRYEQWDMDEFFTGDIRIVGNVHSPDHTDGTEDQQE